MSALPDNVIRLDDRRPPRPEPDPPAAPLGRPRHLRLVDGSAAPVFDLETFLGRARIVMAETPSTGIGATVVPLHAQPA
ncbi:MAG TPA: hypothetical protein VFQ71_10425 [Gaiellales bacterium]|jgi:hypothetical protein|nr:hypothetical protein [Gaiellales bacterium]